MSMPTFPPILSIPELDPDFDMETGNKAVYPGNIEPGEYSLLGLVDLLREHKDDPDAIQFIADMLEE